MTPRSSAGFLCIDFAAQVLEIDLLPWQRWALIHALELLPDGSFRFRTVVVLVARQNGKSTLAQVLALFFMYLRRTALVIGTAQNLDIAEEVWQGALDIAQDVDELSAEIKDVIRVNGKKAFVLQSGERYKVQAANRRGGRGLSGDLVIMDELREHQSWDSWSAVSKTTLARPLAQVWALSNAGDAASIVLAHLRRMAHAALGDPDGLNRDVPGLPVEFAAPDDVAEALDDDSLGIFEWSASPGRAVDDRDGWCEANPALGYTIMERAVNSALRTDPEWVFRTEVLCQWSSGTLEGPFPPGAWDRCLDPGSSIAGADAVGVGVDLSADRLMGHVALAGFNADGKVHVEVVRSDPTSNWIVEYLREGAALRRFTGVALQGRGAPISDLADEVEAAGLPLLRWQGADMPAAAGRFYDMVRDGQLRHLEQPVLDIAAATAVTKPTSDAWLWNRTASPTDIAPLIAATAAVWALTGQPGPGSSAYEDRGLLVI